MRAKTQIRVLMLVSAVGLSACALTEAPKTASVKPVYSVTHSTGNLEGQLALGRYYLGQNMRLPALLAFSKALELDTNNVEARSSRAVVMAALGDLEAAARDLEAAIRVAPGESYLHNNLGFTRQQQGMVVEAEAAFRDALRLDPNNARAKANMERLGKPFDVPVASPVPASQTAAERASVAPPSSTRPEIVAGAVVDLRGVRQTPARPTPARGADRTETAPTESLSPAAVSSVINLAPQVAVAAVVNPTSSVEVKPHTTTVASRIEILNGNGVNGMARMVGARIRDMDVQVVVAKNGETFNIPLSTIRYREGHMGAALKLGRRFPGKPGVLLDSTMDSRYDVVVTLGRDVVPAAMTVGMPPLPSNRITTAMLR